MKVYIAATRQNDGKTIVSLGLIAAALRRTAKVGYTKPVGQHYVETGGHKIDEDAILVKETYGVECDLPDMSPVAIPRGFTEDYISDPDPDSLARDITSAFGRVSTGKEFTLIEGTGHAGVGSVFDMSNADVAHLLGAKVVIVSAGGVGRPIDEIMLNKALFDQMGCEVVGAIVNKVQQDKYDKIAPLVTKGLARKGLEVLGVMPYNPVLSRPTMEQLLEDTKGELITSRSGLKNMVSRIAIGAMAPHEALDYIGKDTLLITPATREDLILAAMGSCFLGEDDEACVSGILLTGTASPHPRILHLIERAQIPVIRVAQDTFTVATMIDDLMVKIRPGDTEKIAAAERLVTDHVNMDRMMDLLRKS